MKNIFIGFILGILFIGLVYGVLKFVKQNHILSPVSNVTVTPTPKPLDKYSFENLRTRIYPGSEITIDKVLNETPNFTSYLFFFSSDGKQVSGMLTIPNKSGNFPVIAMFRGFVPKEIYEEGIGTKHAGEVFAQNGFITLAPDFLGYGESASQSADPLEERYQTYTTALNLLAPIPRLNNAFEKSNINMSAQTDKIGIWGHSNGGHISLTVLEISGKPYPTVLWAPVSKPFPFSILYYMDELNDNGKALRKIVSDFEKEYDVNHYTITSYFDWIQAPIQLHQGSADVAVPIGWSNLLNSTLKKLGKDITYFSYPGDDHNFANGSWNTVVARNLDFYKKELE